MNNKEMIKKIQAIYRKIREELTAEERDVLLEVLAMLGGESAVYFEGSDI